MNIFVVITNTLFAIFLMTVTLINVQVTPILCLNLWARETEKLNFLPVHID